MQYPDISLRYIVLHLQYHIKSDDLAEVNSALASITTKGTTGFRRKVSGRSFRECPGSAKPT
jgi:hypothetical protein